VPAALRVLRRIFRRREDLARELLRTADVDEDLPRLPIRLPHVREVDTEPLVRFFPGERSGGERGDVLRYREVLLDPLLPTAVKEDDVLDPVVLEDPEREGREPVVEIPVQDDPMPVRVPRRPRGASSPFLETISRVSGSLMSLRQSIRTDPGMCPRL